jgi:hypothetical protein
VTVATVLAAAACVLPTDESADVVVQLSAPGDLIVADTAFAEARIVVADVEAGFGAVRFSSSDAQVLEVHDDGRLVALAPGTVDLVTWAPQYQYAAPARRRVTVHAQVEIDSVAPARVRYGEEIRVYGVGLNPGPDSLRVTLDGLPASVVGYAPADPLRPDAFGVLSLVAAPPIGTGRSDVASSGLELTIASARGAASIPTSLVVETRDLYEPNERMPADLGVVTTGFEAVGLAFDELEPDVLSRPYDWYTFTTEATGDYTVVIRTPEPWLANMGVAVASGDVGLPQIDFPRPGDWWWDLNAAGASMTGTAGTCRGVGGISHPLFWYIFYNIGIFVPNDRNEVRVTLPNLPAGDHSLFVTFASGGAIFPSFLGPLSDGEAGIYHHILRGNANAISFSPLRYDLAIVPELDGAGAPDAYEGNDFCEQAPTVATLGAEPAEGQIRGNFDAEVDLDWYAIDVAAGGRVFVTFTADDPESNGGLVLARPHGPSPDAPLDSLVVEGTLWGDVLFSERDFEVGARLTPGTYYLLAKPNTAERGGYTISYAWEPPPPTCDPAVCNPAITVSSPSGAAGDTITIAGSGLHVDGFLTEVVVDGHPVGHVLDVSPTSVTAVMPTLAAGVYSLGVSVGAVPSNADTWTQLVDFDEGATEPNDAIGAEAAMSASFAFSGTNNGVDNLDLFAFTISEPGTVLDLELAWGDGNDLDVTIYPRGSVDPGFFGADVCGFNGATLNNPETATCTFPEAGEYTLEVLYYGGTGSTTYAVTGTILSAYQAQPAPQRLTEAQWEAMLLARERQGIVRIVGSERDR